MTDDTKTTTLSKEEAQLYDRQLRLWGVQSQQRLQQSKVAIVGFSGAASEVCKNIVLAGLNEITIIDWVNISQEHAVPHLFIDPSSIHGQNRASVSKERVAELNTLVKISAIEASSPEEAINKLNQVISDFDLVIASDLSIRDLIRVNQVCRNHRIPENHQIDVSSLSTSSQIRRTIPFIGLQCYGLFGFVFMDLGDHVYTKQETNSKGEKTISNHIQSFHSMESAFSSSSFNSKASTMFNSLMVLSTLEHSIHFSKIHPDLVSMGSEIASKVLDLGLLISEVPELDTLINCYKLECAPVSAILGGIAGQEAIKTLSASSPPPFCNIMLHNAITGENVIFEAGTK